MLLFLLFFLLESFCVCCGSIPILRSIFFVFVLGIVMYDNEFETKESKI